jgi:hypothetical protein
MACFEDLRTLQIIACYEWTLFGMILEEHTPHSEVSGIYLPENEGQIVS